MADWPGAWAQCRPVDSSRLGQESEGSLNTSSIHAAILIQDMSILQHRLDAIQLLTINIQSLPNELLTDIFRSTCTTVEQPPSHTPIKAGIQLGIPPPMSKFSETPKFSTFSATMLSLVCRRWRLVILSDLIIWSDVIISRHQTSVTNLDGALKWATTCSNRSYPTPISISVTNSFGSPEASTYIAHFIKNNGQRIRELKAYLQMVGDVSRDFTKLQSPMPNLEVLEIGCSHCRWGSFAGVALLQLFSRDYPRLKHLSIQHFTTFPPRAFTNLATLVLSYSQGRVTIDDFLALIAGSPRLETLWFKRYIVTPSTSSHPPAPVSLPRLSSVTLENCDSHLILSALKVPDTATLRIMYPMRYIARPHRNTLAGAFPLNPITLGSLKKIRVLSYGVDETTAVLSLKDSQGEKLIHAEQDHKAPDPGLPPHRTQFDVWFSTRFHDLFALDQAVDLLASLTTLELDLRGLPNNDMGGSRLSFWLAFFKGTPLLEVLCASYSYLPAMVDGLNPSNNGRNVLCPSLHTLQLDIRTGSFDLKNDWLLQVIDATRWRGKCGSPLRGVFVYLMSSGYGHDFTLPADAVRAMFSLRDAGVENMTFSNGTTTYQFDKDNFVLPDLPR